jgi:hypothetical protein
MNVECGYGKRTEELIMENETNGQYCERMMATAGLLDHVKYEQILSLALELGSGKFPATAGRERKFQKALERLKSIMAPETKSIPATRQVKIEDSTGQYSEEFFTAYPNHRIKLFVTYVDENFVEVRAYNEYLVSREEALKLLEEKFPENKTFIA